MIIECVVKAGDDKSAKPVSCHVHYQDDSQFQRLKRSVLNV